MPDHEAVARVVSAGLTSPDALPVLARMGEDPGPEYFARLQADLRAVFDGLGDTRVIDRELAEALHSLAHLSARGYADVLAHGRALRPTLLDPDLLSMELAVESVLSGTWRPLEDEDG